MESQRKTSKRRHSCASRHSRPDYPLPRLSAQMNHFAFVTTESVVQFNSVGSFAINYVNPADDPRKTQ